MEPVTTLADAQAAVARLTAERERLDAECVRLGRENTLLREKVDALCRKIIERAGHR